MMRKKIAPTASSPVRVRREARGLTQAVLAERAGTTVGTVSLVERAPGLLRPTMAARLAQVLEVPPEALLVARGSR